MEPVFIVYLLPIAMGVLCGYFLTGTVLGLLTMVYVAVTILLFGTAREIEVMIALIYATMGGIVIFTAWVTYYISTEQTWLQDFMRKYIVRR